MSEEMKSAIRELALKNGFKLKRQPNNKMDLNPYVYDFAEALIKRLEDDNSAQVMSELTALSPKVEQ